MTDDTEGAESPSEDKHYEPTRLDKIKQHVKAHQTAYIVAGTAVVTATVAVAVTVVVMKTGGGTDIVNVVKQFNYKSDPVTKITNITMKTRGHQGNAIRCVETGMEFPSQEYAANLLGLNSGNLSKHLKGLQGSVGGFHFEKLGPMPAAV